MKRLHLVEIEDQAWLPKSIRDAVTDYLQFVVKVFHPYNEIFLRLQNILNDLHEDHIVDLCSGGGGPWPSLSLLVGNSGPKTICLTDKFPNAQSFKHARSASMDRITYRDDPIDAAAVPQELCGFRTLFSSFHHFSPMQAQSILEDAVKQRCGIGIFEITARSASAILWMLATPFLALLFTPFISPFRWSRLVWTYFVPIVPLIALFDGLVSCFRTYTPAELRLLISKLSMPEGYQWDIGEKRTKLGLLPIVYLLGYPVRERVLDDRPDGPKIHFQQSADQT